MAVDLGSASGSLNLDTSAFKKSLKSAVAETKSSMSKVEAEAKGVDGKFKSAGNNAGSGFSSALKSSLASAGSTAFAKIESAAKEAAVKIKEAGKKAGEGFSSSMGSAMNAAPGVVAGAVAATVGAIGGLVSVANEAQEDMGKLESAFVTSGHTVETANNVYKNFVGLLGETDTAVEASNHLAKLTQNTEELATWNTIAKGVYATFGDSIPLEGLTEAANETARLGELTGPLTDALNWAGVSEDDFRKQLAACNSEQERATLITETLNELYSDAAAKYQEVNGPLIEFRTAMSNLTIAASDLGYAFMPIATSIINILVPAIQQGSEWLQSFITSISTMFSEGNFAGIGDALLSVVSNALTFIQTNMPMFIDGGMQMLQGLMQGLVQNAPQIVSSMQSIITSLTDSIIANGPFIMESAVQFFGQILVGLAQMVPQILTAIGTLLNSLIDSVIAFAANMLAPAINAGSNFLSGIRGQISKVPGVVGGFLSSVISNAANFVSNMASKALEAGQSFFNNIVNTMSSIPGQMVSIGSNIVSGIWSGISGAADWLIGKISSFASGLVDSAMSALGIKSPSRVFANKVGRWIPAGIGAGVEEAMPAAFNGIEKSIGKGVSSIGDGWLHALVNDAQSGMSTFFNMVSSYMGIGSLLSYAGVSYSAPSGSSQRSGRHGAVRNGSAGGDTYIFNSPRPISEVEAARQLKRVKREMAEGF